MKHKKKAFTLTELLVVVIVIGVLSAAVLPKFSKVIETRKTTEAEELMGAIRTEQEKRCALDKPYLTDLSDMSDIVKNTNTKNYQLTLQGKGIIASSKGNYDYNLQMPSYADGRICCDGADCAKLNKNYPSCTGFTYEESPDSCAGTVTPDPEPEPEPEPEPTPIPCSGPETQACGCNGNGIQSHTCNTTTGEWGPWSACSISDSCECTGTKNDRRACTAGDTCGFETRTATCDASTGEWKYGSWSTSSCAAKPEPSQPCSSCGGMQSVTSTCNKDSGLWEITFGDCDKPEEECNKQCVKYAANFNTGKVDFNLCCEAEGEYEIPINLTTGEDEGSSAFCCGKAWVQCSTSREWHPFPYTCNQEEGYSYYECVERPTTTTCRGTTEKISETVDISGDAPLLSLAEEQIAQGTPVGCTKSVACHDSCGGAEVDVCNAFGAGGSCETGWILSDCTEIEGSQSDNKEWFYHCTISRLRKTCVCRAE